MRGPFLLPTLLFCTFAAPASPAQDLPKLIAKLNEARQKIDADLTSGYAVGKLRKQSESDAGTDIVDSDIQVFFDSPKYRVYVVNSRHQWRAAGTKMEVIPLSQDEQAAPDHVVIFDGEFVYEVEGRIAGTEQVAKRDVGGPSERDDYEQLPQGRIYFDFKQEAVMRNAGYAFNPPLHLWQDAIKLEQLTEQFAERLNEQNPGQGIVLQDLASGGMILNRDHRSYTSRYYLFNDFDFDFRRVALTLPGAPKPFRETTLYWEQSGGIHYVRRLAVKDRHSSVGTKPGRVDNRSFEIEFSTFDVNSQIDPRVFKLSSLGLEPGTPFDDHRSNVDGKPAKWQWDGEKLAP